MGDSALKFQFYSEQSNQALTVRALSYDDKSMWQNRVTQVGNPFVLEPITQPTLFQTQLARFTVDSVREWQALSKAQCIQSLHPSCSSRATLRAMQHHNMNGGSMKSI